MIYGKWRLKSVLLILVDVDTLYSGDSRCWPIENLIFMLSKLFVCKHKLTAMDRIRVHSFLFYMQDFGVNNRLSLSEQSKSLPIQQTEANEG